MSTTCNSPAWPLASCCARRTPTPRSCRSTPDRQGRAGRARGHHRRRLESGRLRRFALACRPQAARRLADVQAALPGAGRGSRALGRRSGRLRRRRDAGAGAGRRRADRRSTTSRCRRSSRPPRRPSPARRTSRTIAPTISVSSSCSATRRRPTRRSPRPRMSSSTASSSTASPRRPWSRAARSASICGGGPLHHLLAAAARASLPHRARQGPECAGKQGARHLQRHRRQLRHEDAGFNEAPLACSPRSSPAGR